MLETPSTAKSANQGDQPRERAHQHYQDFFIGNGTTTRFALSHTPRDTSHMQVTVNQLRRTPASLGTAYDFSLDGSVLVFTVAPANLNHILVDLVI